MNELAFTPPSREQTLLSLKKDVIFDLLVIGGGATGCGTALDAATRGLSVALVEQGDFAEGTSGRSTKLLHGGVRYLESAVKHLDMVQYHLVRDGLRERGTLLRIAPHLSRSISLVTPLYKWTEVPYVFAGLKLYDIMAGSMNIGHSRLISRSNALKSFPMLQSKGLRAGVSYFDGQFNDARMAVSLALTAIKHGAVAVNYVKVVDILKEQGRISGAALTDSLTGDQWVLRSRAVVNATGPFADTIRMLDSPGVQPMLTVSSGTHLVLDKRFSPPDTGLLIPKTEDGRVLFVMPWEGNTLVGTTDEPAELVVHPRPHEAEIEYLVHHVCKYFDLQFSKSDIKAAWSGLRPLVSDPGKADTAKLSRDHVLEESAAGLLTITGGKWTTYRKMASDTVDYAVKRFELHQERRCITDRIRLHGSEKFNPHGDSVITDTFKLDPVLARHLNTTYGDQAQSVCQLMKEGLGNTLVEDYPSLEAEVLWAARHEMACRAIDVLARRTPLALLNTDAARTAVPRTIQIMAAELGWDPDRCREEEYWVAERLSHGI